ncbi:MAG: DNA gyrase inhibitor YacG [Methylococcaceae bacterium]|jgi:hypothetical protein
MSSAKPPVFVKCPTCKRPVAWLAEHEFKPFCSERCKLIDLGEWFMEEKKIPGQALTPDVDEDDPSFWH